MSGELSEYISFWETDAGSAISLHIREALVDGVNSTAKQAGAIVAERTANLKITFQQTQKPVQQIPQTAGETRIFEELNFRFTPGPGWAPFDVAALNEEATLGYMRRDPTMFFLIIAESGGEESALTDIEAITTIVKAGMESMADQYRPVSEEPCKLNGMEGKLVMSDVRLGNLELGYAHWIYTRHGFLYQLMAYAQKSNLDVESLRVQAIDVFTGFHLIDPERRSKVTTGLELEDHRSERYGYSMSLTGTSCKRWTGLDEESPEADVGGLLGGHSAFLVIPVYLGELDPSLDVLADALLGKLEISLSDDVLKREILMKDGLEGYRFEYQREVDGDTFVYRVEVRRRPKMGYMVAVWTLEENPSRELIEDLLQRFRIDTTEPPVFKEEVLSERERLAHAQIYNELGVDYYRQMQYAKSIPFFEEAADFNRNDEQIIENLMSAYIGAGRHQDGLDYVEANRERFSSSLPLQSYRPLFSSHRSDGRKKQPRTTKSSSVVVTRATMTWRTTRSCCGIWSARRMLWRSFRNTGRIETPCWWRDWKRIFIGGRDTTSRLLRFWKAREKVTRTPTWSEISSTLTTKRDDTRKLWIYPSS